MSTVLPATLIPPAFVTSSAHSWMPSVCFFDGRFCAPVCDAVNPMISFFVVAAADACVLAPGDVVGVLAPPHAAATRPTRARATVLGRMIFMCLSLRLMLEPGPLPALPVTGRAERHVAVRRSSRPSRPRQRPHLRPTPAAP